MPPARTQAQRLASANKSAATRRRHKDEAARVAAERAQERAQEEATETAGSGEEVAEEDAARAVSSSRNRRGRSESESANIPSVQERREALELRILEADAITAEARASLASRPGGEESSGRTVLVETGEKPLSEDDRQLLSYFPGINKKEVLSVLKGTFNPLNLPKLLLGSVVRDEGTAIEFTNQQMVTRTLVGKHSDFGLNSTIWSTTFLTYIAIISAYFGHKFPGLVPRMIAFHHRIIKLSRMFKWQEAVLKLALDSHQMRINEGLFELPNWDNDNALTFEYTVGWEINRQGGNMSTGHKEGGSGRTARKDNEGFCHRYNHENGCQARKCEYRHACKKCEGDHPAHKCRK